jgi:predicted RNA binding protein YcfA (HicA-like mRNA interferase family)
LLNVSEIRTDLSGRQVQAALERAGFVFQRQKGEQMLLRRSDPLTRIVVPDHRILRTGTLRRIIGDTGLSVERFNELLQR